MTATPLLQAPAGLGQLEEHAHRAREHIVTMCVGAAGGHAGGSLSLVEILTVLYFRVLRVDPASPHDPDRDRLVLSKGHGGIALYAVLAERGFFPPAELARYGQLGSPFMAHPNPAIPGVEMPTGSLGHGLALGIGFTLAARLAAADRRCIVVLGDGELQEGSNWEAAMAASSLGLDQLIAVVDRNGLQITGPTESVVALEPLADRWRSFGWTVHEVDGHDLAALIDVFSGIPDVPGKPTVVIAHTVKARGLPYVEGRPQSHFVTLGERQLGRALGALRAARPEQGT
jgi:transketolase